MVDGDSICKINCKCSGEIFLLVTPGASAAPNPRLLLSRDKSNQKRAGTKVPDPLLFRRLAAIEELPCHVNFQFFF